MQVTSTLKSVMRPCYCDRDLETQVLYILTMRELVSRGLCDDLRIITITFRDCLLAWSPHGSQDIVAPNLNETLIYIIYNIIKWIAKQSTVESGTSNFVRNCGGNKAGATSTRMFNVCDTIIQFPRAF